LKANEIHDGLKGLPFMRLEQGLQIQEFILRHGLSQCLELGFYHGVSSAYIAGALKQAGQGHLVTIDRVRSKNLDPNIEVVLGQLNLAEFVTWYYEPVSYNWRLMKFLEGTAEPLFDFCYIDGGHTWYSTGFAFCLVSRLLKPGGWIIFDDIDWTHDDSMVKDTPRVKAMALEERSAQQVRMVYELLVKRDSGFENFLIDGQWAFAQKSKS
jgi:predicted O-methyltransferase YrrM